MAFSFEGKNPEDGIYTELASLGVHEGVEWKLFYRPGAGKITMVISAQGKAKNKANYRNLVWDGTSLRDVGDALLLRDYRAELHASLLEILTENIGPDSEYLAAGFTRGKKLGMAPSGDGWVCVSSASCEDVLWNVYRQTLSYKAEWNPVKIVAAEPVASKANYFMKWNKVRFSGGKDTDLLDQYRPKLLREAMDILRENDEDIAAAGGEVLLKAPVKVAPISKVYGEVSTADGWKEKEYVNLGSIGVVRTRERDLLVAEVPGHPDYLEVRGTEKGGVPSAPCFVVRIGTDGQLETFGGLDDAIKSAPHEVWVTTSGLLKQHFFEKELYS